MSWTKCTEGLWREPQAKAPFSTGDCAPELEYTIFGSEFLLLEVGDTALLLRCEERATFEPRDLVGKGTVRFLPLGKLLRELLPIVHVHSLFPIAEDRAVATSS